MTCAVLCTGTELTRGELLNSNAAWLAGSLTALGFEVPEHVTIDDDKSRIVAALQRLSRTARIIVCTGGLGPTTDDVTTEAVANALGVGLLRDPAVLDHLRRRLEGSGRALTESNAKQADFPHGADVLPNPLGSAPGFAIPIGDAIAFFLPGVPTEMKRMFEDQVLPRIRGLSQNNTHQIRMRTYGLPESIVGERLAGVEAAFAGVTIGYRAHLPEVEVKVLARAAHQAAARDLAERAAAEVRQRLGDYVFGDDDDSFPAAVGRVLRSKRQTLAIAESCTGGLVGHLLTREPGASDFLLVDAVTYANSAKSRFLGVEEDVIRWHGAVSGEVAAAMAEGARRASGADVALALTGVAGPSGGSDAKPVGTVFIAVASAKGTTVEERHFGSSRNVIQVLAAYAGLAMVRDACLK